MSCKALLFMNLLFVPFMLQHSCYVLLLELFHDMLKYYDPSYQCFTNTLIKFMMVHVTSKIILSFYHLPTRGRAGVKLGDVDTLQMYL